MSPFSGASAMLCGASTLPVLCPPLQPLICISHVNQSASPSIMAPLCAYGIPIAGYLDDLLFEGTVGMYCVDSMALAVQMDPKPSAQS